MSTTLILSLIPLFPLLGSIIAFVNGKKNPKTAGPIATTASLLSFLCVVSLFMSLPESGVVTSHLFTWFSVPLQDKNLSFEFLFRFDQLTAVMGLVVTGIGTLIHLYSCGYMSEDPSRHRFFSYLNLFLFSMLLLILGGNLLVLFVGWEGVGLCSYLLIGFWFKNISYAAAGRKAFVVNRIGDAGFLLGMFLLIQHVGSIDFLDLQNFFATNTLSVSTIALISFLLFVGATGKSAQIPLFVWLPDAMAGPTPVSALIHAATMVTAGIYMMARLHFMFDLAPMVLAVVCAVALVTAFLSATIALTQNDIKKVLAYSTVSQLGFMFMGLGASSYAAGMFHVMTHAFFKACLFLGAGSVIYALHHEQDIRHMGGLFKKIPVTAIAFLVSCLAIAGLPPFSGFFSKDEILLNVYMHAPRWVYALSLLAAFLTSFYMFRLFAIVFLGKPRGHEPHPIPFVMNAPVLILGILAVIGGFLGVPHILGGHNILGNWLGSHEVVEHVPELFLMGGATLLALVSSLTATLIYSKNPESTVVQKILSPIYKLAEKKFFVDEIYEALIVKPIKLISEKILAKPVDQGVIDGVMVHGFADLASTSSKIFSRFQTGVLGNYVVYMWVGVGLLIWFFMK